MLAADGPRVYLLRKAAGLSSFLPAAEWERKDIMEQPEIKVIEVPTGDLVPYANNAKLHSQLQVEQIANSIEEFGFNDPIAVWENADGAMEVVEGHGRVLAAQKLGLDKVPVFYLNHLTDEQRRAYTHVHNQTTLSSGFDIDILDQEIELLDFDWESFGFETEEEGGGGSSASAPALTGPSLAERFGVPPFSVLNAREGAWQDRKRQWMALGIKSELGRGGGLAFQSGLMEKSRQYRAAAGCR